jgi:hypothetical protein
LIIRDAFDDVGQFQDAHDFVVDFRDDVSAGVAQRKNGIDSAIVDPV